MRDGVLDDGLIHGRCKIHVANAEKARARIFGALVKSIGRGLDEGEVLVHRDGARIRRDFFHPLARIFSNEGQGGFDVCVLREVLRARKVDCRARGVDVVVALT